MKTSEKGIALIKSFEKFVPTVYICPAGKPTIGYGHVVQAEDFNQPLTEEQASELLLSDLCSREAAVDSMVKVPINQNQFDALVSFAFNVGIIALKGSTLLRYLNGKRFDLAAGEFLKWNKMHKNQVLVVSVGLARRRKAEMDLFQET